VWKKVLGWRKKKRLSLRDAQAQEKNDTLRAEG
jgi:hypothetical protein